MVSSSCRLALVLVAGAVPAKTAFVSSAARPCTRQPLRKHDALLVADDNDMWTSTRRPRNFWKKKSSINAPPGIVALGVIALFGQLSTAALVALVRLGLLSLPPINEATAIANAAMDASVADGTISPYTATLWAYGFWADLLKQYYAGHYASPADFVNSYCADAAHTAWCLTAKEAMTTWR